MNQRRPNSNRRPSLAVVIQGPLYSSGNSGNGQQVGNFDCRPTIDRIIKQYRKIVTGFVLSTWSNQSIGYRSNSRQLVILENEDPGPTQTLSHNLKNNDIRQALSSLAGIREAVRKYDSDYIIKIRTDQFVDIAALYGHMLKIDREFQDYRKVGQSGFLYFPNMLSYSPFSVGDFYIGGRSHDLENFFCASVRYARHSMLDYFPWVHSEIIHKHIYFNIRRYMERFECTFPPRIDNNLKSATERRWARVRYPHQVLDAWAFSLQNSICLFPRFVLDSFEWRGNQFDPQAHTTDSCFAEWLVARKDPYKWHIEKYPQVFKYRKRLNAIHKLKYFSKEKFLELEYGRIPISRRAYSTMSGLLLFLSGEYLFHDKLAPLNDLLSRLLRKALSVSKRLLYRTGESRTSAEPIRTGARRQDPDR